MEQAMSRRSNGSDLSRTMTTADNIDHFGMIAETMRSMPEQQLKTLTQTMMQEGCRTIHYVRICRMEIVR